MTTGKLAPIYVVLARNRFSRVFNITSLSSTFNKILPMCVRPSRDIALRGGRCLYHYFKLPIPTNFRAISIIRNSIIRINSLGFRIVRAPKRATKKIDCLRHSREVLFDNSALFTNTVKHPSRPNNSCSLVVGDVLAELIALRNSVAVVPNRNPYASVTARNAAGPFLLPFGRPCRR